MFSRLLQEIFPDEVMCLNIRCQFLQERIKGCNVNR